jgi:hypothetical protein
LHSKAVDELFCLVFEIKIGIVMLIENPNDYADLADFAEACATVNVASDFNVARLAENVLTRLVSQNYVKLDMTERRWQLTDKGYTAHVAKLTEDKRLTDSFFNGERRLYASDMTPTHYEPGRPIDLILAATLNVFIAKLFFNSKEQAAFVMTDEAKLQAAQEWTTDEPSIDKFVCLLDDAVDETYNWQPNVWYPTAEQDDSLVRTFGSMPFQPVIVPIAAGVLKRPNKDIIENIDDIMTCMVSTNQSDQIYCYNAAGLLAALFT